MFLWKTDYFRRTWFIRTEGSILYNFEKRQEKITCFNYFSSFFWLFYVFYVFLKRSKVQEFIWFVHSHLCAECRNIRAATRTSLNWVYIQEYRNQKITYFQHRVCTKPGFILWLHKSTKFYLVSMFIDMQEYSTLKNIVLLIILWQKSSSGDFILVYRQRFSIINKFLSCQNTFNLNFEFKTGGTAI